MVTKQQQLEWLAKTHEEWPFIGPVMIMSDKSIGAYYGAPMPGCHFVSFTEWQQEREKISSKPEADNSWYERGELPPVGCECEIKHKCWCGFERFTVVAITKEYVIVEDDSVVAREQHYHLHDMTFRPLRTEREKAIEDMSRVMHEHDSVINDVTLGALYDAGYRKVKP